MSSRFLLCSECEALNRVSLERLAQGPKCGKCKQALPLAAVAEVGLKGLHQAVGLSPVPVVVDFWAPWCGPCRAFAPTYQALAEQEPTQAVYLKLNTDQHSEAGQAFNIQGIPTLVLFEGGREIRRQSGALPAAELRKFLAF